MSKTTASKSHVEDALGGHSKQSQRPEPAHQYTGQRTSLDIDEAKGSGVKKVKPEPAHQGPRSVSEVDETVTKKNRETKR